MARFRFTILGCGASPGVPRIDGDWGNCDPAEPRNARTRCSALIERFGDGSRPTRVLIDTGPDVRSQLLGTRVDALDGVVYTHAHADHVHGIDDLRAFWLSRRALVDIYSDDATQERLQAAFGYCFHTPPGGSYPPILKRHRIVPDTAFTIDGPGGPIALMPFRQVHGDIDSLGIRVHRLVYSCDVSDVPETSQIHLRDLDVWVVDALRERPHPSHFSLAEALDWSRRFKPGRTILTHMHAEMDYRSVAAKLPNDVVPAHDGMVLEFDAHD